MSAASLSRKRLAVAFALLAAASLYVHAEGKRITFSADRMSGTSGKKNGRTSLSGNASVTVGTLEISGDTIELSGKDFRFVKASGKVSGKDEEKGFTFSADSLSYDRDTEIASFVGSAVLTDTKNEVDCSAGYISYNQKTEVAFLQVDVKLKRRRISCESGFALYRRELSLLDLTGSPQVTRGEDRFAADRISVELETEKITLDGSVTGTLKDEKESGEKKETGEKQPVARRPEARQPEETQPEETKQ